MRIDELVASCPVLVGLLRLGLCLLLTVQRGSLEEVANTSQDVLPLLPGVCFSLELLVKNVGNSVINIALDFFNSVPRFRCRYPDLRQRLLSATFSVSSRF